MFDDVFYLSPLLYIWVKLYKYINTALRSAGHPLFEHLSIVWASLQVPWNPKYLNTLTRTSLSMMPRPIAKCSSIQWKHSQKTWGWPSSSSCSSIQWKHSQKTWGGPPSSSWTQMKNPSKKTGMASNQSNPHHTLNSRQELFGHCRHKNCKLLIKPKRRRKPDWPHRWL